MRLVAAATNIFVYHGELLIATDRDKIKAIRGIGRKVAGSAGPSRAHGGGVHGVAAPRRTKATEQVAGDADDDEDMDVDPLTGEATDTSGSWNIVWDLQSTHSTKMARQHYPSTSGFLASSSAR